MLYLSAGIQKQGWGEQLLSSGEGQFGLENTFHTFLVIEFDCLAVLLIQNFHKRIYIFFLKQNRLFIQTCGSKIITKIYKSQ